MKIKPQGLGSGFEGASEVSTQALLREDAGAPRETGPENLSQHVSKIEISEISFQDDT